LTCGWLALLVLGSACQRESGDNQASSSTHLSTQAHRVVTLGAGGGVPRRIERVKEQEPPFHLLSFKLERSGRSGTKAHHRYSLTDPVAISAVSRATVKPRKRAGLQASSNTDGGSDTDDSELISITTGLALSGSVHVAGNPLRLHIVGLPPRGTHPSLEHYRATIKGRRAVVEFDDHGRLLSVGGTAPLEVKRELTALLLRFVVPLPTEKIGIGARWKVVYAIGRGGIYIAQTTHYELVAVDGHTLSISFRQTDSAEPQPMVESGKIIGSLIALKSELNGTVAVSLVRPTISVGEVNGTTTFHARLGADGEVFREADTHWNISSTFREQPEVRAQNVGALRVP